MCVTAWIGKISSNTIAIGLTGIPLVFIKASSIVDSACAYSAVYIYPYFPYIPLYLKDFQCCPNSNFDYRPIFIFAVLAKATLCFNRWLITPPIITLFRHFSLVFDLVTAK
jgi:hypothetical protein